MILYRILFVLGLVAAPVLVVSALLVAGSGGADLLLQLGVLGAAAAVLAGAWSLARRGRPGAASLLLLLVVLPGLLVAAGLAWIASSGFGPHH